MILGLPKLYSVYGTHNDSSGATESQRQDPSEGMSSPVGQTPSEWHGKGKYVPAVWSHHQRQGRNHGNQQVYTAVTGVQRGEATSQPEGGGTHRTGSGARRGRRSQEVAGRSPFGGTRSPEQSDRSSIPSGTGDGENVPDHGTVGGELGDSRSMKTGQKTRLLGSIKKANTMWERWYEAIKEEEKLQGNKDITVQFIDFCEATTSEVHAVLR